MKRSIILGTTLLLAACATAPVPPEEQLRAGLGQTARVGPVLVTPTTVLEDSRCPTEVNCVWAGKVIIRAALREGRYRENRDFTLGQPEPVMGGRMSLIAVTPDKSIDGFPTRESYRFTFAFEPGVSG